MTSFRPLCLESQVFEKYKSLNIGGTEIKYEDAVKLLGVTFDDMLNFDQHISDICKKARQILFYVLLRLSRYISSETKKCS